MEVRLDRVCEKAPRGFSNRVQDNQPQKINSVLNVSRKPMTVLYQMCFFFLFLTVQENHQWH